MQIECSFLNPDWGLNWILSIVIDKGIEQRESESYKISWENKKVLSIKYEIRKIEQCPSLTVFPAKKQVQFWTKYKDNLYQNSNKDLVGGNFQEQRIDQWTSRWMRFCGAVKDSGEVHTLSLHQGFVTLYSPILLKY